MASPTTAAPACPGCGSLLVIAPTGRRPVWCSMGCRQRAYKARQAASRHAADADYARDRTGDAIAETARLAGQLAGAWKQVPLGIAAGEHGQAVADCPQWEPGIIAVAAELEHAVRRVAVMAGQHARSAGACRDARATAGLRIPDPPASSGDETRAGCVAEASVAAAATEPDLLDDPDALFDAIEEVVSRAHASTAAGSALPDPLADAISDLADEFSRTSGAGPYDALIAASRAVVQRARLPWKGTSLASVTALAGLWHGLEAALPDTGKGTEAS